MRPAIKRCATKWTDRASTRYYSRNGNRKVLRLLLCKLKCDRLVIMHCDLWLLPCFQSNLYWDCAEQQHPITLIITEDEAPHLKLIARNSREILRHGIGRTDPSRLSLDT